MDDVRETGASMSIVIPAHDEGTVIERCLGALLADARPGELEVVVAANGCTDDTVERASRYPGVTVLDLADPGKTGALNRADDRAVAFPRIYLDADVVLTTEAARAVAAALQGGAAAAIAAPRPHAVTDGCTSWVRWYYDIWSSLPVMRDGYVGSGVFAVSEAGHARLAPFPPVVADDQYARRRFPRSQRRQVSATFDFLPARNVRALVHRSVRVQAGNRQLVETVSDLPPEESTRGLAGVLQVVRDQPRLAPQAVVFVLVGLLTRRALRQQRRLGSAIPWNRDDTAR